MAPEEDLAALERRLAKLENRQKDAWDKAAVVVGAFVPVTIAILSGVIAMQGERTRKEIAAAQIALAKEQRLADAHLAEVTEPDRRKEQN